MTPEQFELHANIEDEHWWFVGRRNILKGIVAHVLGPARPALVIDIGCGTGGNLAVLSSDYSCIGIDISERACHLARQRFPAIPFLSPDVLRLTIAQFPEPKLVLLLDVLEHIEDDLGFVANVVSFMKEQDYLLVTVPASMSLWSPHDIHHGHYRRYDRAMLEQLWKGLNVCVMLVSHFNVILFPIICAVRGYNRLRNKEWGEAGTDMKVPSPWVNRLLTAVFSSEKSILIALLKRGVRSGLPFGVSLVALLRKGPSPT